MEGRGMTGVYCHRCRSTFWGDEAEAALTRHMLAVHGNEDWSLIHQRQTPSAETLDELAGQIAREVILDEFRPSAERGEDGVPETAGRSVSLPAADAWRDHGSPPPAEHSDEFRCDCGRTKPCSPCELFAELGADVKRPRIAWPV